MTRPFDRRGAITLSLALVGLASCSDRLGSGQREPANRAVEADGAGLGAGFFVDRDYLAGLCVTTGLAYPIKTDERTIDGSEPTPADATRLTRYREVLAKSLGPYARRFFDEIGLRTIVLCRNLAIDGVAGHAFADVERGRLFLSIDSGVTDAPLERALHHEIFHFVDFAEDHRLDEDSTWSALNPPTFVYGEGGASMQADPGAGGWDDGLVGFLDRYATSALAEDKAEVYSWLIVDGGRVARRAAADPIIQRKVDQIRLALRRLGPLAPTDRLGGA